MIKNDLIKYDSLEKCLKQFETIEYECYGNKVIMLFYDYHIKKYEIIFRNPKDFKLFQELKSKDKSPLISCHKTIDFINNNRKIFSYVNK